LRAILKAGEKHKHREEIGAYLELIIRANKKTFLEVQKMGYPTMEEVLTEAGYLPEWLERGKAEGMEAGKLEIARKMKNAGRPFNEIKEFTGLPLETIEQL
jgi:predicted transposase/invertase (TIGR01784 family)